MKKSENQKLISIVVPVYNVEKYLVRCVSTLIKQTYVNIEIILVDDGSTDKSGELCDELGKKDSRIIVLHKKNGGLSSARNAGLKVAKGDYIGFVDSDDWVTLDMYQYCVDLLEKTQADAVQIDYLMARKEDDVLDVKKENVESYHGKDILQYYMYTSTVTGSYSVWRCLFTRRILDGILFREGKINEDIDYRYKALAQCSTFTVSNQIKYFYFQDDVSLSKGGLKQRDFDLYDAAEELYKLTSVEEYGSIRKLGKVKKSRTAFSLLCKIAYYGVADTSIDKRKIVTQLTKEHRKNILTLLVSPMKISRKILAVMLFMSYRMTECVVHICRKL